MNTDTKHSEDYLNSIFKNKDPFKTPADYFTDIEDRVLSQLYEEQLPKEHSYDVPSNYFEEFEERLLAHSELSERKPKVIQLKSRILRFIPAAAAACIFFFIGFNYLFTSSEANFNNISSEALELWFQETTLDVNSEDLFEFVDADFTENDLLEEDNSISDADIVAYLETMSDSSLLTVIETQP